MRYQKATFYFLTGTGNSYRVAAWMAAAAAGSGIPVTLRPIESARPAKEIRPGEPALLGLTMPTHGFTAPWAMLRFALRLPRGAGAHAVVVATRAGLKVGKVFTPGIEGTATYLIALILALKGYRVRGATGIDMPSSWIAVHPGLSPAAVAAIVARARTRTSHFMAAILSGRRRFAGWIPLLIGLAFIHISLAYALIGRFFLARLFFASDRCTGCGLCAEHCPNGAIVMRGSGDRRRPYWTFRCESCMRCMAYCPTRAVEANYLLAIGAYVAAALVPTSAILAWLAARATVLAVLDAIPRWAFESIYAIAVLALAYPLLHLLLRVPWINAFFTRTTPTHYYRRYHAPETTLKDLRDPVCKMTVTSDAVRTYYAGFGEREWARLESPTDGALEFAITCRTLALHLPPDARVLDIGGGPGRYTVWLAQQGHRLTLADLSPELLVIARTKIAQAGVDALVEEIVEADARDLSRWADGSFDAVLCLGPFYHLPDPGDRHQAATELCRVLRPGGLAFVALMPRYAFVRRTLAIPDERHHLAQPEFVAWLLQEGVFVNDIPGRFTHGYGVRPQEVAPFFERYGFATLALLSAEGIAIDIQGALFELAESNPDTYQAAFDVIYNTASDPSILGMASHLLYVGRREEG
jgi:ubiquinone/menaquinone biosynthesis C-methylase UbiE/formate hydrogenlyase subunit 6/NADH:ubiquinone oxidoreductase subunit I